MSSSLAPALDYLEMIVMALRSVFAGNVVDSLAEKIETAVMLKIGLFALQYPVHSEELAEALGSWLAVDPVRRQPC